MHHQPEQKEITMNPILSFKSHTAGKNADVNIYTDRIEWSQKRSINWWVALFSCGLSLLIPRGKSGTEMIPMRHVSSVVTVRKNPIFTAVRVVTSGNTIDFTVSHEEATNIQKTLNSLVLAV